MKTVFGSLLVLCTMIWSNQSLAQTPVDSSQLSTTIVRVTVSGKRSSHVIFCLDSNAGKATQQGNTVLFTPYQVVVSKQKQKNPRSSKLMLLKAISAAGKRACSRSPKPTNGTPTPTTAVPTPTPQPSSGNFDAAGNVTEQGKLLFEIPSYLLGNVTSGRAVYQSFCVGCHVERVGYSYTLLDTNIRRAPMLYDESAITRQQLADLTAYLNRFRP